MGRGFLMGAGWGTVVAGFGLVVASQVSDLRPMTFDAEQPAAEQVLPDTPDAPQDAVPKLPEADAAGAPPAAPSQSEGPSALTPPEALALDDSTEEVVLNTPETASAAVPEAQTAILVHEAPGVAGPSPVAPLPDRAAPVVEQGATLSDASAADTPPATDSPPPATLGAEVALADEKQTTPEAVAELAPSKETPAEPIATPEPEATAFPDTATPRPAPGFDGKIDGVKTGRLPSISTQDPTEQMSEPAPEEVTLLDDPNQPPIDRFAAPFENPSNKPLFAILLQDTGRPDIDREALASMAFPVTFVIDPTQPDAAMAAQIYRAKGKEVLILATGIPAGANASDVSVSMEVITAALPEAVGVVDLENSGFQGNRTLSTQVLALIRDQGLGILTWDKGLNAASQVARREGMRSALIFRSLDNEGEDSPLISRYLDRAAFKAAQDGRVVVAGKTRPETVAAVLQWALEGRAATVALAPSTAVMTSQ